MRVVVKVIYFNLVRFNFVGNFCFDVFCCYWLEGERGVLYLSAWEK